MADNAVELDRRLGPIVRKRYMFTHCSGEPFVQRIGLNGPNRLATHGQHRGELHQQISVASQAFGQWIGLSGPTGEANLYAVRPREHILCLAEGLTQIGRAHV